MGKNLYSLGLLRNGKVYANKDLAIQGLTQAATNDGVAKLARYLEPVLGGDPLIKTIVGFYANAAEMEDAGGGASSYTILDIEGSAADIDKLKDDVDKINDIIGDGITDKTLTEAINEVNDALGEGFSSGYTVADAIDALGDAIEALAEVLTDALTVSLEVAAEPTSGYLKTYILSQGTGTGKTEVGRIDIPKDFVVESGSLVHGTWDGDTFTEDPAGTDTAIKLVIANQEKPIYINTKDLVDFYTGGDGVSVNNDTNVISLVIDPNTEEILILDANGLKISGITAAIEAITLEAGNGISIEEKKINAVAAAESAEGITNPISVDENGIKFASILDCGFFDNE